MHSLRHTAAVDVLRATRDVRLVQQMLGHQTIATTERYLKEDTEGLESGMSGRSYGA